MKKKGVELYLSKDIVQGEDIQFYLLWDNPDITDFEIKYSGFNSIVNFYNIKDEVNENITLKENKISINQLKQNFYLGGILRTIKCDIPFQKAELKVICKDKKGSKLEVYENRTLFSTSLEVINNNKKIQDEKTLLDISLDGRTTLFLKIENAPNSNVKLVLHEDIQSAFEKFKFSLIRNFEGLKIKYPQNTSKIDLFLDPLKTDDRISIAQCFRIFGMCIDPSNQDDDFIREAGLAFLNAVNIDSEIYSKVIRPLNEYFQSSATKNVFLDSPFLTVEIPKGKSNFKGRIYYQNLIERKSSPGTEKGPFVEFFVTIDCPEKRSIPLKEAINIQRLDNGRN
jgi:hypothetical protein